MSGYRFYIIDESAEVWGTDDEELARNANEIDYAIVIDAKKNKVINEGDWGGIAEYRIKEEIEVEEDEEE